MTKKEEVVEEVPKTEDQLKIEELETKFSNLTTLVNEEISKRNEIIEILTISTVNLINVDMKAISNDIRDAEVRLNSIGTAKQFENIREIEKHKGPHMAYQQCKRFLEEGSKEAQMSIPTLNLIKMNIEKISEKLKYIAEA